MGLPKDSIFSLARAEEIHSRAARGLKPISELDAFVALEGDVDLSALDETVTPIDLPNIGAVLQARIVKLQQARAAYIRLKHGPDSMDILRINSELEVLENLTDHMGMALTFEGAVHFYQSPRILAEQTFNPTKLLRILSAGSCWEIYWSEEERSVFVRQDPHLDPDCEGYQWPEEGDGLPEDVREEAERFRQVEFQKRNPSRWSDI
jgi:hypothetical protein